LVGAVLFFAAFLSAAPASADEKASLANVLLIEQLVDVATTQQLLSTASCGPPEPVFDSDLRRVGTTRRCAVGSEADPLAQPFVTSPLANVGAAVAINGLVRLASRNLTPRTTRWLRLAVELYPAVIVQTVSSIIRTERFRPAVSFSVRRRI
jgi:hypothetical protein